MSKVLFVSNTGLSIYIFRLGLMKVLRDKNIEVVAVGTEDGFSEKLKNEGFRFIPLHNVNRKGKNPIEDIVLLLELFAIYKKEKPDFILHFRTKPNLYGTIAARLCNIKSICTITGLGYLFIKTRLLAKVAKALYKIALSFAEKVVFQNPEDRNLFVRERIVDRQKTLLSPGSGIDTSYLTPKVCQDFQKDQKSVVFLLISRMIWDKGIAEFIEAARIVKQKNLFSEFWLLGPLDGGNPTAIPEDVLKGWESDGVARYLGPTDDVRPFICKSDVVVLPSYREGTPRSLLEAMSMAKPVITTQTPGCDQVVDNGKNGFLVSVKDAMALADAMLKFIHLSDDDKKKMGVNSRAKAVKEFDESIVIDIYLKTALPFLSLIDDTEKSISRCAALPRNA